MCCKYIAKIHAILVTTDTIIDFFLSYLHVVYYKFVNYNSFLCIHHLSRG